MENADVFSSSTAPLTWHDFLERMRHPSASDFVKAIKSFIVSFLNNDPDPERDSAAVQDFLSNMEAAFRSHSLWAGCSEEELESAGEGLEKYVMTKLFTRVYASLPEEVNEDNQLHQKVALIQQFIRPENLDIQPIYQNETSWLLAQKELQKINMYKAPRDKLVCILNCCKVINNLLLNASVAANENPPGADEFLPVLIYVTIKANPPQLHSNLLYIQRYRRQSRLVSEAAYFFTNMLSAESFIMNIDAKSISMEETEFQKNMEFAQALLFGPSSDSDDMPSQSGLSTGQNQETKHSGTTERRQVPSQRPETKSRNEGSHSKDPFALEIPSISDLENSGANMLMKDEKANQVFMDFPYLYAKTGDLTINDVEELLNNYKQLVFKYVCLSKGMGVPVTPVASVLQPEDHTKHMKEPEDNKTLEPNDEKSEKKSTEEDDSEEVSKLGAEKSESNSLKGEDVASQDEIGGNILQN